MTDNAGEHGADRARVPRTDTAGAVTDNARGHGAVTDDPRRPRADAGGVPCS